MGSCFCSQESASPTKATTTQARSPVTGPPETPLNPFVNRVHEIVTEEEFDRLKNHPDNLNVLIVCDFYAAWCTPCVHIAPALDKWASDEYRTNVVFLKIDVDKNSKLSNFFTIDVLPTFIFFKRGRQVCRLVGDDVAALKREIDALKDK